MAYAMFTIPANNGSVTKANPISNKLLNDFG